MVKAWFAMLLAVLGLVVAWGLHGHGARAAPDAPVTITLERGMRSVHARHAASHGHALRVALHRDASTTAFDDDDDDDDDAPDLSAAHEHDDDDDARIAAHEAPPTRPARELDAPPGPLTSGLPDARGHTLATERPPRA